MNRAILVGRLGSDPESKSTKGGNVCRFNLATSEKYTGRDREKHEETEWHRIVVFGGFSEACMRYLKKGSMVLIEGKIKTRAWETDSGEKKYVTEIIAARVMFLDSKGSRENVPY